MLHISRTIKIIFTLVFALVIGFVAWKFFSDKTSEETPIDSKPISYVYLWNNDDFLKAEKLTIEGEYDEALDVYNKLLASDLSQQDDITKSQLNIRIATLIDLMGEKDAAIDALNKIAVNEKEYFITRSFAYEYMARMLYETRDPSILQSITKYTSLRSDGKDPYTDVAIQLLGKSKNIAPLYLGMTEQMKISLQSHSGTYTKENTSQIRYDLGVIDSMIRDINAEQNKGYMLPLALLRKAQIAERIDASGNYGLPKTVEEYYKDALKVYETYPEARSYNYAHYEYARYLANKFGADRKADIISLIAHYEAAVPEKTNLKTLLQNIEKTGMSKRQSDELKKLKSIASLEL